ncbi:MAG: SusE domain-containing protein [Prolixibacteraceae bacterium]|nr:SusE domain-containing protein [Prolixibacteraceae bacterium]
MKKIIILFIALIGLFTFHSCEEFETEPVIKYLGVPNLSYTGSSSMLLSQETANDVAFSLSWSTADFGYYAAVNYSVQLGIAGTSFGTVRELSTTSALNYSITVGGLNDVLTMLEQTPDAPVDLELRLKCFVSDNTEPQYSKVISFTAVPYSVKLPPIYLLGDATDPGWDNVNALPAPYMSPGVYGIVAHLKAGAYIKFIKTLGAWAPQWGTDANGTNTGGNLVYRPDEATADPPAIPSPDVEGDYRVVANIDNLTYVVYPIPDVVYLVGGATTVGWDAANAIAFTKDGVGKYSLTTELSVGNGGMKILASQGAWAPQWGAPDGSSPVFGKLVYRATEANPDPPQIPEPSIAGTYKIVVDFTENTYTMTKQ